MILRLTVLALAALALVPVALGATAKPPAANGQDYLLPNGTVYQFSNGAYHLIPDVATANAMGLKWNVLIKRTTIGPVGAPIPSIVLQPAAAPVKTTAPLMLANGRDYIVPDGQVYQLVNGTYRLIPDLATANAMHVLWNKLIRAKSVGPVGQPLPSVILRPQQLCTKPAKASTMANGQDFILPDGDVYQLSAGVYHLIPDVSTANAMKLRWNQLHSAKSVSPIGAPIASVCGTVA